MLRGMEVLYASPDAVTTPLAHARRKERTAAITIALIVGFVLVVVARTALYATHLGAGDRHHLVMLMLSFIECTLALTAVLAIRQLLRITVDQIEQSQASQIQTRELTQALYRALARPADEGRRGSARPRTRVISTIAHDSARAPVGR